jgi:hypothetical protein
MKFSISSSTGFANINWDNFEKRPPMTKDMPLCSSFNWEYDVPCCTDGYVISDTLQMAAQKNKLQTKEAQFLTEYPCVNSLEFEEIVDNMFQSNLLEGLNTDKSTSLFGKLTKQLREIF